MLSGRAAVPLLAFVETTAHGTRLDPLEMVAA
jgi:hypothetical protein